MIYKISLNMHIERTLVSILSYILVDFIIHGLIIDDFFWSELDDIARTGSDIKYIPLLVGMAYFAALFAYFLNYVGGNLKSYLVFGGLLGSMFIFPYHIVNYSFFYNYSFSLVIIDTLVTVFEFIIVASLLFVHLKMRIIEN